MEAECSLLHSQQLAAHPNGRVMRENCSRRQEMSKLNVEFLTDISNTSSCLLSDP